MKHAVGGCKDVFAKFSEDKSMFLLDISAAVNARLFEQMPIPLAV
jgi:hypothetical protein